jgi:predicted metal-dependent phosphoesterase TrpH
MIKAICLHQNKYSNRQNTFGNEASPVIQQTTPPAKESLKSNQIPIICGGILAIGIAAFAILKGRNSKKVNSPIENNSTNTTIKNYKESLVSGLKNKFNISVKQENLNSIMGADELKTVLKDYTPDDFAIGNHNSKDPKEFFKNVAEGNFRVSLHGHSEFSDGIMTPQSFIDMAAQYADKVAKKLPKSDTRPAFIIALTDHDNFEGCQEIVKIIAQNPEKYKNLKFVPGAELSVKHNSNHFDLTALGVNPFDENLNKYTQSIKDKRTESAKEFITQSNKITGQNLSFEEIEKDNYKGKKTLQNKSGVVFIRNIMKVVIDKSPTQYSKNIKAIFNKQNYSNKDIPDINLTIDTVKKAGGALSLTHPAKSFPNCNLDWYKGFLTELKNKGVSGIEANHQYTFEHHQQIGNIDEINKISREFAKDNDMFISGGTDNHRQNIFGHHHNINDELLKDFLE